MNLFFPELLTGTGDIGSRVRTFKEQYRLTNVTFCGIIPKALYLPTFLHSSKNPGLRTFSIKIPDWIFPNESRTVKKKRKKLLLELKNTHNQPKSIKTSCNITAL